MADLFLSYSPKDAEKAHIIARELETKGSTVHYTRPDPASSEDLLVLDSEINQASWVIVLWSRNALEDGRITYEAMLAREKNNLLSVQIEPNSIPTEFNNLHSADHVNYQNQLTSIIQQALNPETQKPEVLAEPAVEASHQAQSETPAIEQDKAQNPQVATTQQAPAEQSAPAQQPASSSAETPAKPVTETVQADTTPHVQHRPVDTGQLSAPSEPAPSPRQNLQQRLAETTQGTAPPQTTSPVPNQIGQQPQQQTPATNTVATNSVVRRDLPQQTQSAPAVTNSSAPASQDTAAAHAAIPAKSSKLVPIALMSSGILLLGSVGAGYWYLAKNTPAATTQKNYKIIQAKPTKQPVQVAVARVQKPTLTPNNKPKAPVAVMAKPAPIPTPATVAPKDDILDDLIASSTPPQKAVANPAKDTAKKALVLTSAQRGEKSISQCLGCHSFKRNEPNKSGPNLHGVANQLIGSERKFNYSDTLRSMGAIGEVWSQDQLDCYLKNPAVCMPGTKMSFNGVKSSRKRKDIIAYLNTLK